MKRITVIVVGILILPLVLLFAAHTYIYELVFGGQKK